MKNLIIRALSPKNIQTRNSAAGDSDLSGSIFSMFGGLNGSPVNHHAALSLSAVFNAVDQISNDIAKLPKGIFQKIDGNRQRMNDHPVDYLISKRPNVAMTQFSFHKALMISALLRGNGIAVIKRNKYSGIQTGFDLVNPDDIKSIKKKDGNIFYELKGFGILSSEDVIHIPGFSFNGITGISVFKYASKNLGAALSAENFADENFKSKGLLAGIIKTDKSGITPSTKNSLANAMETRLSKGGTHNIGFLDEGMDFQSITASAQEAALIDWKKISIEDVARWFNIAPHKIKHLDKATFSNIEQQSLDHGSDCIMPWAKKFEEEYDFKLFTEKERGSHYVKFNTNALIRTDMKTKSEFYSRAINFGWKTRNEVRDLEDDNRIDGLDEPLTPSNAQTVSQIEKSLENGE